MILRTRIGLKKKIIVTAGLLISMLAGCTKPPSVETVSGKQARISFLEPEERQKRIKKLQDFAELIQTKTFDSFVKHERGKKFLKTLDDSLKELYNANLILSKEGRLSNKDIENAKVHLQLAGVEIDFAITNFNFLVMQEGEFTNSGLLKKSLEKLKETIALEAGDLEKFKNK